MKRTLATMALLVIGFQSMGQVTELAQLRAAVTLFVNYDRGKVDTIPHNAANTAIYKTRLNEAFMAFALHKDTKNLTRLKEQAINNKTSYILDGVNYFFSDLRRDPMLKSLDNNTNHLITFYGLYDYGLPNFVSMCIQPYTVRDQEYVVYSYSLNGEGTYVIKEVAGNHIVFESASWTSSVPILKFKSVDSDHILLVEDLGDHGQMAFVLNTISEPWIRVNAFEGQGFDPGSRDYSKLTRSDSRPFLRVASNRAMTTGYGKRVEEISFDDNTQTISYIQQVETEDGTGKVVQAKWSNGRFEIDDYYLGQHLHDEPMPFPMD